MLPFLIEDRRMDVAYAEMENEMKLLVTGADGFIGSHLVEELVKGDIR